MTQITNYCFVTIKNKNTEEMGLERWLSRQQHLLLSQRTWVQFPATYTVAHNYSSSFRSSDALFWPQRAPDTHTQYTCIHTCTQNTPTHKIKVIKSLRNENNGGEEHCEMLASGDDTAVMLMNSLGLWLELKACTRSTASVAKF